jgi:hypothetical protein
MNAERNTMKKPAKKKLVLDRDVIRVFDDKLDEVAGGKPGCSLDSSCVSPYTWPRPPIG